MVKKLFFVAIIGILSHSASAQKKEARQEKAKERKEKINKLIKQEEQGALIFNKQSIFGIKLSTDGYGIFWEKGKFKTTTKTSLFRVELGERKHPKEEKLTRGVLGFAIGNPYVYGKQNNFYYLNLGIGQQKLIGGKGNKNGVAVSAIYGGGLSAGLLKPYYIQIQDPNTGQRRDIKYENNDSLFLAGDIILGSGGLGKGFNEMKFTPGAHAKVALRFDYGRYNDMVSAIEVGLNAEFYSQKMPILLRNKEKQFFYNAYVAINFGKRK